MNNTDRGSSPETTPTGGAVPDPATASAAWASAQPPHPQAGGTYAADASAGTAPTAPTGFPPAGGGQPDPGAGPAHGQPAYSQVGYAQYGQPGYAQPQSGQPFHGTPGYGVPAYGTPAYGASGYPAGPVHRVSRSRSDRVLGGVCGGLARYWNTDATLLRIIVVVLTLATGGAFLLGYLLAWLLIPAETDAEAAASFAAGGNPAYGGYDPATGAPVGPRPARSYLGMIVLSASVLVAGVLGVIGLVTSSGDTFIALALAAMLTVLGIGLIIGAWYGRARWLVVLAIPLLLVSMAGVAGHKALTNTGSDSGFSVGTRAWAVTPADAAEGAQSFSVSVGDAVLDLTKLTAGAAGAAADSPTTVDVSARVGLGQLVVRVPADMQVNLDANLRAGQILLPGETTPTHDGTDIALTTTLAPSRGLDPTYIVNLSTTLGAGNLEVHRDAA